MIDILVTWRPLFICLLTIITGAIFCSFFEWTLHLHVMHTRRSFKWKWFERIVNYPFNAHAIIHHHEYKDDHTYHHGPSNTTEKIRMALWNAFVLVSIASLPFLFISVFTHYWWSVWVTSLGTIGLYFTAYEYLHWCMHLPKGRFFESERVFARINADHALHHHRMNKNLNVVWHLADRCLGTYIERAPKPFNQPGEPVPNLQPRHQKQTLVA